MKLTLRWLSEFVELPTDDPHAIAAALESLGHEVEEIRPITVDFRGVVIGRVLEVAPHPNADRVRVCQVDVGGPEPSEIVCGAWNFDVGAVVPVATPGAVLGADFEIARRDIRGVVSNGMICSESELGLGEDAAGIMVLNDSYPSAVEHIGEDVLTVLGLPDVYFDIAITPNRPDCMSVVGLARELAAYYETAMRLPPVEPPATGPASDITVRIDDTVACPRFVGREVKNLVVKSSPHWIRHRLVAAGVRPINNVVDASNYAMIELGHPTHAFDADRLGDVVVVRRAEPGERIVTLDDQDRALEPGDIVVADADRPVAIAGVMGGAETEVHDGTTRILIEAAYWEPASVLLTSKRLGLRSEASARFERGMDPNFCVMAADRVAQLLEQTSGATVVEGPVDEYPSPIEPARIELPLSEIPRVLGISMESDHAAGLLSRLGFGVGGTDPLTIDVPTRRPDVTRPVDLIEELARLNGFDSIPDRIATGPGGGLPRYERNLRRLRDLLTGAGYHEALTFSFIGAADLDKLGLRVHDPRRTGIHVVNPLRDEEGVMRTTLLPGLLKAAANNVGRHIADIALFEVGKVFLPGAGKLPEQPDHVAFVALGTVGGSWEGPGRPVDVYDATGMWELIARELEVKEARIQRAESASFHPGRSAEVFVAGESVGTVGEIHPAVARAFDLPGRVIAGELSLAHLLSERSHWQFATPSPYPPVIFDLAFEMDDDVEGDSTLTAIDESAGPMLERCEIFDVFRGHPIPEGRKSIAVRLWFRASERTLTDEEMAPIRRRVVESVVARTQGVLRGEV